MGTFRDKMGRPIGQLTTETNGNQTLNDGHGRRIGYFRDGDTYGASGKVVGRNSNLLGTLIKPYDKQ